MPRAEAYNLQSTYLRLRSDATAERLPFDDSFWTSVISGRLGAFRDEYLVMCWTFDGAWPSWEQHPNGDEIVCLLAGGAVTFVLEGPEVNTEVKLERFGDYVFVPKGVWHTAKADAPATMLGITAGEGTQMRPA